MEYQIELAIKILLDAWNLQISRTNELLNQLTDEQLEKEVSPGRNTGVYLLGHLTAVHDAVLPLFGISEKLYPQLEEVFIKNPDKSGLEKPSIKDIRNYWNDVNNKLSEHFNRFTPGEWFQKHTSVSEEDFKKEPHRNRLNVLVSRTNHLSYHRGQLVFLKN
ncbi:MAG TPA: DinB family protein [Ginsengibacter sp.]|nr:DinB family protein [Ginsengibacter sp.]